MNLSKFRRSFSLNTSKPQHKPLQDLEINEPQFSILTGKELYVNKILSKDLSTGQSSRIYYNTTNLGVPFQWEKKPGTPMNPPLEEPILQPPPPPPPLPPPSRILVLPRPNVDMKEASFSWRWWLWRRRLSKNIRVHMYDKRRYCMNFSGNAKGNKVSSVDGDLDAEFVGWKHDSKSSSTSTLSSSTGLLSNDQFESFRKGVPFCCAIWRRHKWSNK